MTWLVAEEDPLWARSYGGCSKTLRRARRGSSLYANPPDDADGGIMARKPLRCRIGLHKWVVQHQVETGVGFYVCTRCEMERAPDGPSVPHGLSG